MTDVVVFRRWRDCSGDIIALFPEIPADDQGVYCQSYMQVGQHGAADYHSVIRLTAQVSPKQYAPLAEELWRIGYDLRPLKHATQQHHDKRQAMARYLVTADTGSPDEAKS
jgi:hypothetical protein